ncbi:MAG: hypothetical protein ACK4NX_02710 [Candidatus Paceibacteria bacterium]
MSPTHKDLPLGPDPFAEAPKPKPSVNQKQRLVGFLIAWLGILLIVLVWYLLLRL